MVGPCRRHSVNTGHACNPNRGMQKSVLNTTRGILQLLPHSWLAPSPMAWHTPEVEVKTLFQADS